MASMSNDMITLTNATSGLAGHRLRDGYGYPDAAAVQRGVVRVLAAGHPRGVLGPDAEELIERIAKAREKLGSRLDRARAPLPARGHHPVRGLPRRLVQALAVGGRAPGVGVHRLLRRALHGGGGRHPQRAAPEGHAAEHGGGLLHGRHGRPRRRLRGVGRAGRGRHRRQGGAGDLHELGGVAEGVLRQARRHRLHLQQRRRGAALGLRAGREGALLPGPAPGPQHRRQDGHPAGPDDAVELQPALTAPWAA